VVGVLSIRITTERFIYLLDILWYKMVQIQVDLTKEENKTVNLVKAQKELKTKEQAVKEIIKQHRRNKQ